jgi:hypothetical protein
MSAGPLSPAIDVTRRSIRAWRRLAWYCSGSVNVHVPPPGIGLLCLPARIKPAVPKNCDADWKTLVNPR